MSAPDLLFVVVDPAARHIDGESVRIARDVLRAGAPGLKLCLPHRREEVARLLARRGRRRPVVVGDDQALLCAVQALHAERAGPGAEHPPLSLAVVPVGPPGTVSLAAGLGVPTDAVHAARAVLEGAERRLDLLVEDTGAVLFGPLRIPGARGAGRPSEPPGMRGALGRCASAIRPFRRPPRSLPRLRVEADGVVLAEPGRPVAEVSVSVWREERLPRGPGSAGAPGSRARQGRAREPGARAPAAGSPDGPGVEGFGADGPGADDAGAGGGADGSGAERLGSGLAEVVVRSAAVRSGAPSVTVRARAVTVSGPEYRARTWTVAPSALRLTVPGRPAGGTPPRG